ncbi:Na+/H+ antiporter subunit G [Tabrizicola sp.]|uniref:Na+/H+ antiporter subunit G n=1 Tax=Tabrizicola sp. TaxID=2005166 RepID=UPI001A608E41|nr:Na+/H+ antiporter subunit G [Tabrizicola sp.]MBL9073219.1 Na+/H+ antiporter subunit G [Tabrizicola sp.]
MTPVVEGLIAALLIMGGSFGLIGSFGLLKLRQPMQRLHAPTKATTIGVGAALFASALGLALLGHGIAWQEILVSVFLFLTAPLSALYLAKTHLLRSIDRRELPPSGTGAPWATLAQQGSQVSPSKN